MIWFNLLWFALACSILVVSGTFLVKSIIKISGFLHISEYIVAFILMAFATSLPELFVGISSALANNTELCLGNVIGSNIADIGLVAGIIILLARGKISTKPIKIRKDSLYMLPIAILPLVLFLIGRSISRIDGLILIAVFCFYGWRLVKRGRDKRMLENKIKRWEAIIYPIVFIVSLALLFLSADLVVKSAGLIALDLALPAILIGLLFVAIGTSIPELVFESRAVMMGRSEMALGDLIGSVVVNSTLVLGVTALIRPITANFMLLMISVIFMVLFLFLFATFAERGKRLYITEGIALLLLYIIFIFIEMYFKGFL